MVRTTIPDAVCPACDHRGLDYNAETIDLPYLGESLETMLRCSECGYRHVDFILTQTKDPMRYRLRVATEADMMVRVVRSASGTIRIPELGIDIEPGAASEAFITNVEGILLRVDQVLGQLYRDADDDEMRERVATLQRRILDLRLGQAEPVTLVLEDPFGNSAIIGEAAIAEPIPAAEAAVLKVGAFVFDQEEKEEE